MRLELADRATQSVAHDGSSQHLNLRPENAAPIAKAVVLLADELKPCYVNAMTQLVYPAALAHTGFLCFAYAGLPNSYTGTVRSRVGGEANHLRLSSACRYTRAYVNRRFYGGIRP